MPRRRHREDDPNAAARRARRQRAHSSAPDRGRRLILVVLGLIVATVLVYTPSFKSPFELDDRDAIVQNATIRQVTPLSVPLSPPRGSPVAGRPVVNLSFALNNALDRSFGVGLPAVSDSTATPESVGFHVVNLAIHLACALVILALLMRTLPLVMPAAAGWGDPDLTALFITAVWILHPIQTEAVDYVTQRTEILVSFFYVATMYAAARMWDARGRLREAAWALVAVIASLLGMGSKEVMITAPLMVVLYDCAFHWPALRDDRGARWRRVALYAALFATTIPLLVATAHGARSDTVGFGLGITWYQYLYTQAWAVGRYLTLILWPARLTFDYGQRPIGGLAGVPGAVVLTTLLAISIYSWRRAPRAAFLGTAFFLLLAPSSSIVPIRTEIAAERRVYLALLPVIVLLTLGAQWFRARIIASTDRQQRNLVIAGAAGVGVAYAVSSYWTAYNLAPSHPVLVQIGIGLFAIGCAWSLVLVPRRRRSIAALVAILAMLSARRSAVYGDPESLWRDAVTKLPTNARAFDNLGAAILQKDYGRADEARQAFGAAILADSTYPYAWTNLADLEVQLGRPAQAQALLEHVLRIIPNDVDATRRLGGVMLKRGDATDAIPVLERVAKFQPSAATLGDLAMAYAAVGRTQDAERTLARVAQMEPHRTDVQGYLAALYINDGRSDRAVAQLTGALRADSAASLLSLMSLAQVQLGHIDLATAAAKAAVNRPDADAQTFVSVGRAMMMARRPQDAIAYFTQAVSLSPNDPEPSTRLAMAEAAAGNVEAARVLLRKVLAEHPEYEPARRTLEQLGAS